MTETFPIPEEINQFYESKEKYGKTASGQSKYELHNYLECKSGNKYEIGIVPEIEIETGKAIEINETKFLHKIKSIEYKENGVRQKLNLSVLLDPYVLFYIILTLGITVVHIFKKHALIEYGLCIFSGVMYALTFVYLYYL